MTDESMVLSVFVVANGIDEIKAAFRRRPRFVADMPGFAPVRE